MKNEIYVDTDIKKTYAHVQKSPSLNLLAIKIPENTVRNISM